MECYVFSFLRLSETSACVSIQVHNDTRIPTYIYVHKNESVET